MKEKVDWSSYNTSEGKVHNFDEILSSFFSAEEQSVAQVAGRLEQLATCQGWLYEIAPFLADALVDHLVCAEGIGPKLLYEIYSLLWEIVSGYPDDDVGLIDYHAVKTSLLDASLKAVERAIQPAIGDLNNDRREIRQESTALIHAALRRGARVDQETQSLIFSEIFRAEKNPGVIEYRQEILLVLEGYSENDTQRFWYEEGPRTPILGPLGPSQMRTLLIAMGLFKTEEEIVQYCEQAVRLDPY